jgi:hypothetical protein
MTRSLRPEARPIGWEVLNEAQKGAFRKIVTLLSDALPPSSRQEEAASGVRRGVDEWLSDDRSSRTIFLDGGRGSGKTTILLSLMQASSSRGKKAIEDAPEGLRGDLQKIREHVVWLQPIDMEPAPENFHFLGAILARIEQVVGQVGLEMRAAGANEPPGLLDPSPSYYSALTKLRRLQTSVALAWDGNIQQRGPRVDPDTFAQEVMRTEKSRLSLNREVQRVLDELASTVMRSSEVRDPLFVLPIDDFDLNPPACLPMLRMLRMISVPRLFTVLLGDYRVAQVVLNLKLSSDIARVGSGAADAEQVSVEPSEVARCAGGVADNALRKLAPPSQCIQLGRYDLAGGLQFRPIGSTGEDWELYKLLGAVPMAFANTQVTGVGTCDEFRKYSLKSYLSFLVAPALYARGFQAPKAFDPAKPPDSVYQGVQLVESSPRRLADLWLALNNLVPRPVGTRGQEASPDEPTPGLRLRADLLDYLGRECRRLLKSEPALNRAERETVPPPGVNGGMAIGDWDIANLPVRLKAITSQYATVDTTPPEESLYEARVSLLLARHWQLHVLEGNGQERATPRVLLPETTALYVAVYDLLSLLPDPQQPRPPRLETLLATNTSWAATEWSLGGAHTVTLRWPIPPLASVWGFDQFTGAWNRHLSSTSTVSPEESVFAWLSLGSAVLIGEEPVECERGTPSTHDWQELSRLLQRCVELTPRARDWAIKVVSFLMPEFALPPLVVGSLASTDAIKQFARRYRPLIRRARVANLGLLWDSGFEGLVHDLRKGHAGVDVTLAIRDQFFKTPANRVSWTAYLEPGEGPEATTAAAQPRKSKRTKSRTSA